MSSLAMVLTTPTSIKDRVDRDVITHGLGRLARAVDEALSTLAMRQTPKAVHEARIAARRLQASLRYMKRQWPSSERKSCMVELSSIVKECSAVRDADVRSRLVRHWLIRTGFRDHEQAQLLREAVDQERIEGRRELRTRIHSPKWDKRLWKLRQHELALIKSGGKALPRAVIDDDAYQRSRGPLRNLPNKVPRKRRQIHRLRLRIKDARYFREDFGALCGAPREREIVQLRALQKTLGDLHDEWALRRWLRAQYKCYLVAGEILAQLKAHKREMLKRIRHLLDNGHSLDSLSFQ